MIQNYKLAYPTELRQNLLQRWRSLFMWFLSPMFFARYIVGWRISRRGFTQRR